MENEIYIKRQKYLDKLVSQKDKSIIKVITGLRRSGKSVLLNNIFYDYLLKSGVDKSHIIKVNLEYKKNEELRNADKLYAYITGKIGDEKRHYIFIDEVQLAEGFEDIVNELCSEWHADVYLTGSNSKMLSKDINTKLRGRSIEIRMFPLSFAEYYAYYGGDRRNCFNQYLLYGGLPYLLTEDSNENKIEYLKMICDTVIARDIIERHKLRKEDVFNAILEFLCSNIGSYVSAEKIANTLRSNGIKSITDDTVGAYIQYMCDAFLFYKAQRYDIKGKEYLKTQNKYYISDLGVRNSKLNYRQIEITHSLENVIYLDLLRRGYTVDIGKNASKEIDFVARSADNIYYIQVAYTMTDEAKKEQELSSFRGLDDGYKKIVITMDDDPFVNLENGYKKINVFDFLLNDNALEQI